MSEYSMAEGIDNTDVVVFRERDTHTGHRIGFAQLNAERSLNALTLEMVRLPYASTEDQQAVISVRVVPIEEWRRLTQAARLRSSNFC